MTIIIGAESDGDSNIVQLLPELNNELKLHFFNVSVANVYPTVEKFQFPGVPLGLKVKRNPLFGHIK